MEIDHYQHGEPCWADASCPDVDKAADFYAALLGWEVPEGNPDFGGYRNAHLNGRPVAGLMGQMEPGPTYWGNYFKVDDAEAAAALIEANGGSTMVPAMDVGDLGRMAIFADPLGAAFGIWQPGEHLGSGFRDEPGAPCWVELMTTDTTAAKAFYAAVFGWTWGGAEAYAEFQVAGRSVGGLMAMPPTMPEGMPPVWSIYYTVADIDASVSRAGELGGAILMPATAVEGVGRFAVVADPNGAVFNIMAFNAAD